MDDPSQDFNWEDLWVIVRNLPKDSALQRAIQGDEQAEWTVSDYLLAMIADSAQWLVWSKTKNGAKGKGMPKPILRPGQNAPLADEFKGEVLDADEMIARLGSDYASLAA